MGEIPALEHSRDFPPSSMAGREVCTAPAILGHAMDQLPPEVVTMEGQATHHILEVCLKTGQDAWEFIGLEFAQGEFDVLFTTDMVEEIQPVIDGLRTIMAANETPAHIEERLTMPFEPEMFGTSDFWLVDNDGLVVVVDLKFGFILVEPDAFQLAIYLLMGLLETHGYGILQGDPDAVIGVTGVAQPRAFGHDLFRFKDWTRAEMQEIMARVKATINRIHNKELIWQVGPHCRYCHLAGACPRMAQVFSDAVMAELIHDPALEMTGVELDRLIEMIPVMKLHIKRLEELGFKYLDSGGKLDNVKIVWKRAPRRWKDADEAKAWLTSLKVDPYLEPKMKSPAQAEKDIPKSVRAKVKLYTDKKSSGLTIAPAYDARTAVNRQVSDDTKRRAKIAADKLQKR